MKKKLIIISTILLISISVAGNTFAWFSASSNNPMQRRMPDRTEMSTIDVRVLNENVEVQSLGTGETYVRVRLVPKWSDQNLSVANIKINLNSEDWTSKQEDGYYYYKKALGKDQTTSNLIQEVTALERTPEYDGASFEVKALAEGVQKNKEAVKRVWGIDKLPF